LGCAYRARRERRGARNRFVILIALSKPNWRVITAALDITIAELWRAGLDTVDIANALEVPEFEVANRLMRARWSADASLRASTLAFPHAAALSTKG